MEKLLNMHGDREPEDRTVQQREPTWFSAMTVCSAGLFAIVLLAAFFLSNRLPFSVSFLTLLTMAVATGVSVRKLNEQHIGSLRRQRQEAFERSDAAHHELSSVRASASQATMALTKMRDGVVVLSPESAILLINPWARRLLTLSPDGSYHNRSFREVVRIPELTRAVDATFAGQTPQKVLVEIVDGVVTRPVKVRVDRITSDANSNVLMILRDETEAQQIEAIRRDFIANLSHEIKTPLAAIKGYAETAQMAIDDDPGAAVHFMGQIHGQCVRLERLVADMMQLARAQAGREHLHFKVVSLPTVIAESLRSNRPIAEANQITLAIDPNLQETPDPPSVVADHEAVLTIVNNLVSNAIRYTPHGGSVRLACREEAEHWILSVSDTGVGIAANEQKRVFERFYRGEKTRELAAGGTGIGLSIVRNLTLALGGEVSLKSVPGKGSTFEIKLPASTTLIA
ncbi:Signal-transduction histidine kinase senX3 [Novipirellula aureliae]|uniref:histidine kinase n=1 Tax=Novipirellula aureliae TaxID=2527966 RepID=A0A5C6DVC0_9BACT|nr:ATP-binding protein [Novipirellula aureliae]TWU39897.1 Signal-transduction histidine kinase senX3 [Novipirellula aureliae]